MARKIFVYQIAFLLVIFAQSCFGAPIDDVINSNPKFSSAVIGISVKDLNSGSVIYQKNQKTLVHPASTLKMITAPALFDYLGENYKFKTSIYRMGTKVYLKVGADPIFTYDDMLNLASQYKSKNDGVVREFYIDDTIIDKKSFGEGWQWDDNASIYFPQISPYIINRNLFAIEAKSDGKKVSIEYAQEYKENVINELVPASITNIISERDIFSYNPNVKLKGGVKETEIIYIPALEPERLYKNIMAYAFLSNYIAFNSQFKYEKVPIFAAKEATIEHSIEDVLSRILLYSDNMAAEVLAKHAGAAKTDKSGTTKDGLSVVKDFYVQNGVNINDITMVDASGASMNDYVNADFMTNALIALSKMQNFSVIKNLMTDTLKGTFKGRVSELNGKIKVKTGTLANTSAVVGYLKTNSGRDVAFAIMLDNLPKEVSPKQFENEIIRAIAKQ